MLARTGLRFALTWIALVGCSPSAGPGVQTTTASSGPSASALAASSSPAPRVEAPPNGAAIDAQFTAWLAALPPPASLSEANGASTLCSAGRGATFGQLDALGKAVPVSDDADLPALVKWTNHADPCLRHIAMAAILAHVPFDRNMLVIPSMDEPDHHLHHWILKTLLSYLDDKRVQYAPSTFAGMHLDPIAANWVMLLGGGWKEDEADPKNFYGALAISRDEIAFTTREVHHDAAFPDHTLRFHVEGVHTNTKGQIVVDSDASTESNADGYQGPRQDIRATLVFWPIRDRIVWFDQGRGSWAKMLKAD
jgi:hypothetical protein